jgi:Mn-containing catalase
MQYTIQGWNCMDDIRWRDLLTDIATEELSHLEAVGALIRTSGSKAGNARAAAAKRAR